MLPAHGTPFVDPKAPLPGPVVRTALRRARARVLTLGQLPPGPARGPSGQQKGVQRADNMISPYFEMSEAIGVGMPKFQAFKGGLG